jgi:hypothetical protein
VSPGSRLCLKQQAEGIHLVQSLSRDYHSSSCRIVQSVQEDRVNPAVRAFALALRSRHLRIDAIVQEKCVANLPEHAAANRPCNHRAAVRVVLNIQVIAIITQAHFGKQLLEPIRRD